MGRIKDVFIDKINENPNDIDWDSNQLNPPPIEIDLESGKCMWLINEIRVWADNYTNALKMYNEIVNWNKPDYETD